MADTTREMQADGTVVIGDARCKFTFRRYGRGVLEMVIAGTDTGQFGTAAIDEVSVALMSERPLELFVDASEAAMPAVNVSQQWTRFIALNQKDFKRVSVLVGSRAVELTMAIAQHLSQTGKLMQIYSDEELYEARKVAAREGRAR
jgi:hypothetical protein